jgi:hypothetical protein
MILCINKEIIHKIFLKRRVYGYVRQGFTSNKFVLVSKCPYSQMSTVEVFYVVDVQIVIAKRIKNLLFLMVHFTFVFYS